jgi:hypothetical protein
MGASQCDGIRHFGAADFDEARIHVRISADTAAPLFPDINHPLALGLSRLRRQNQLPSR